MRQPLPELVDDRLRQLDDKPPLVLRRPERGKRPFGYQSHLITQAAQTRAHEPQGKLLSRAVELLYGFGAALREAIDFKAQKAMQNIAKALTRCTSNKRKCGVLKLHVARLSSLQAQRRGYRVQGPDVFAGHEFKLDADGKRVYLRMLDDEGEHQQGGLAKKFGVSVRTVRRWSQILRDAGVWDSVRPPRDAPDARLTRSGAQVYTQWWLAGGTPKAILDQLAPHQLHRRERPDTDGFAWRRDEWDRAFAAIDGADDQIPF